MITLLNLICNSNHMDLLTYLYFLSGLVGLAISYALSMTSMLSNVLNSFTETEREMIAVERVGEYITQVYNMVMMVIKMMMYIRYNLSIIIFFVRWKVKRSTVIPHHTAGRLTVLSVSKTFIWNMGMILELDFYIVAFKKFLSIITFYFSWTRLSIRFYYNVIYIL